MLPTNSHTYPNHCAPCARHRSHVDSSWFRLVQRVRMTLGRSSQAHNIAASRCLMFSSMSTHAASCSFSLNGECNYHSCSSILRDQHRCAISAQIPIVNANKQILVIVPRMPLMPTFETPPGHTMSAPISERHVRHHMAFPLGFRWCARLRQQPDTFSILSSITLAIHVGLFLCMWSDFAFLLGILQPRCDLEPHLHFSRVVWSVHHLWGGLLDSGLPVKTRPPAGCIFPDPEIDDEHVPDRPQRNDISLGSDYPGILAVEVNTVHLLRSSWPLT